MEKAEGLFRQDIFSQIIGNGHKLLQGKVQMNKRGKTFQ